MSLPHSRKPLRDIVVAPVKQTQVEQVFAAQIIDGVDIIVDPDMDLTVHPDGFYFIDKGTR